jgi:hypothetical protein
VRKFALAIVLAAALAPTADSAPRLRGGLWGVVRKGPTTPVCRADVPCDAPAQVTLVFRRGVTVVARGRSDPDGRYRISIPPGYYAVRTQPKIGFGAIRPLNVHVRAGHFDRLDFSIDTGIR